MRLSSKVLGTATAEKLGTRAAEHVLIVGSDKLTRGDLAEVGCFNYLAAQNLTAILAKFFTVENLRDLYEHTPPRELALPHLGVISLAVLGAAFEVREIGGDDPLENYVKHHSDNGKIVTFDTIKLREERREGNNHTPKRRRRRR